MKYDVIIVGGGPAGSFLAWKLAEHGVKVAVLEEDPHIGHPCCCAGIVGIQGMKKLGFKSTEEWISHTLRGAEFVTPNGSRVVFDTPPVAWVIDRPTFDRDLAERAAAAGVDFFLKTKAIEVTRKGESIKIRTKGLGTADFRCEILVGADGPLSTIANLFDVAREFIFCAQVDLEGENISERAVIWLGNKIAPGFFAWTVPAGSTTRIGLGTTKGNPWYFLHAHLDRVDGGKKIVGRNFGLIPRFFVSSPGRNRIILVGDAAGQVKPLTGGGLYYGLSCADMGAKIIADGLTSRDLNTIGDLYSREVRQRFEREIKMGSLLRDLFLSLSDDDFDQIVSLLGEEKVKKTILKNFDFEHHSSLVSALIKKVPFAASRAGATLLWAKLRKIFGI
jgi:geranylgeranyl reductase family protein